MKISLQQVMIGSILRNEDTALSALKTVRNTGCGFVELNEFMIHRTSPIVKWLMAMNGMPMANSGRLNWSRLMGECGLAVSALHTDLNTLIKNTGNVLKDAELFQTDTVVITAAYGRDFSTEEGLKSLAAELNETGRSLAQRGIRLLYHNHNIEFLRNWEGILPWFYLAEHTEESCLGFELDCFYAQSAGMNVEKLVEHYHDRIRMLHLTDLGMKGTGKALLPIVKTKETEPGKGSLPLKEYIRLAVQYGMDALVLEMHNGYEKNALSSCVEGLEFIAKAYKRR